MNRFAYLICAAAIAVMPNGTSAQTPGTPARPTLEIFPSPGAPAIYKSAATLDAVLKSQMAASKGIAVSLVQLTDRTSLNIVRRSDANGPIAHRGWTEVHYIVDGGGVAEVGGTIDRSSGKAVATGAVQKHVKPGDIVIIPANSPHHYKDLDGFVTYYEIRFPDVPGPAPQGPARGAPLPPAPAAGGPGIFISGDDLAATLAKNAQANSAEAVAPVLVTDRFSINEVERGAPGAALAHAGWNEMHYILAGNGTLVTSGKLTGTGRTRTIDGGVHQPMQKGDIMIVPSDTPHQYADMRPSITYLEVRFPNAPGQLPRAPAPP
jgi:mannose-6-phosphate isomerase-like protein (cupin superfamily)